MTAIAPVSETEVVEILPGFSPKPASLTAPYAAESPSPSGSGEPDTEEPVGGVDGPNAVPRTLHIPDSSEFSVRGGVVEFS